jgi:hypothetical protein
MVQLANSSRCMRISIRAPADTPMRWSNVYLAMIPPALGWSTRPYSSCSGQRGSRMVSASTPAMKS